MSEPLQLCALCAMRPAVDREHIPAKALFPKPRPDNLITVPACSECNEGTGLDDEYMRSYFALRVEHKPSESLTRVRETAARAFVRPEHRGLQEAFARTMSFDWLPENGGQVLTLQARMTPDLRRVLRVVRKHARGLFYHVTGRILPAGTKLLVMPDYKAEKLPEPRQRALDTWAKYSLTGTRGYIDEVFGYALRVTDDNPNAFVLSLLYYKTFFYLVATRPRFFKPDPLPGKSWDHAVNVGLLKSPKGA